MADSDLAVVHAVAAVETESATNQKQSSHGSIVVAALVAVFIVGRLFLVAFQGIDTIRATELQPSVEDFVPLIPPVTKDFVPLIRPVTKVVRGNHLYRHEDAPPLPSSNTTFCAPFELDPAYLAARDAATFPWHPAVGEARGPEALYASDFAFRRIWEHQHPANCSASKFMVLKQFMSGIGSNLHVFSGVLAYAMQEGRVLLLSYSDKTHFVWYDEKFCPKANSWECWLMKISNCSLHEGADVRTAGYRDLVNAQAEVLCPDMFHKMLTECSGIKPGFWYHWFRSVSIAYLVRLNPRTRQELDALRAKVLRVKRRNGSALPERLDRLPRGTIHAHVRHGDKWKEMNLVNFSAYLHMAERLAAGDQGIPVINAPGLAESNLNFSYHPATYAHRTLYVSTEDPRVMEEALALASRHGSDAWDIIYCDVRRKNEAVIQQALAKGKKEETLESLLSLELSLEADAWICTLNSNWCRLIDELRSTVAAKAFSPYINLPPGVHNIPAM